MNDPIAKLRKKLHPRDPNPKQEMDVKYKCTFCDKTFGSPRAVTMHEGMRHKKLIKQVIKAHSQ